LHLLDSFPDQLVKLLRLCGERLHLVLSELRLKRQNFLNILCLGDLLDEYNINTNCLSHYVADSS
jgi:hypothetical protein